jgi:hypothetical protein
MSTQNQAATGGILEALGYEMVPSGKPGSPEVYKISDDAVEKLKGKTVTVASDGSVTLS